MSNRSLRTAPALAVLVLYPLLVLLLTALLGLGVGWLLDDLVLVPLLVGLALVALVVQGWRDARAARRDAVEELQAPELTRGANPRLWAVVDELAEALRIRGPERIVAEVEVNAAVTEFTGRREMVLGVPLLAALDVAQLRAVIAHELGHYAAGHTGTAGLVYRVNRFLDEAAHRLPPGPVRILVTGWAWLFGLAAGPATTRFEDEADDRAAQLCGAAATAAAMRRTQEVDAALGVVVAEYVDLTEAAGLVPPLREALAGVLAARPDQIRRIADRRPPRDRLDAHRPLHVRIERMHRRPAADGTGPDEGDPAPAWSLLGPDPADPEPLDAVEAELVRRRFPRGSWAEAVTRAGRIGARHDAEALGHAAAAAGVPQPVTLDGLLGAAARHGFPPLLERLAGPELRGARRSAALQDAGLATLLPAVVWSLLQEDRARFALDWSTPWRFESDRAAPGAPADWAPLALDDAIAPALRDRARVAALRARLEELRVPLHVPLTGNPPGPDEAVVVWAVAPGIRLAGSALAARGLPRRAHLVVCSTGLALLGEPAGSGRRPSGRGRPGSDRLQELAEQVEQQGPGAGGWLPAAEVALVQLRSRRVTFVLRDDDRVQVQPTVESGNLAELLDALFELFAGRVVQGAAQDPAPTEAEGSSSSR